MKPINLSSALFLPHSISHVARARAIYKAKAAAAASIPPRARTEEMPNDDALLESGAAVGVTAGPVGTLLTSVMLAQVRRAPPALWITTERLPMKAPIPSLVER